MKLSFIVALLLFPICAFSQVTITGRILNQPTTKPVPNVSVFLSNATIGDNTNAEGRFTLNNVKPGKYELVVSALGYDIEKRVIVVSNENIQVPDITIFPKAIGLNEVTVRAPKVDYERQRNYDMFKAEFLGNTKLAAECKIINPELLDLDYDVKTGTLTASSVDFLTIENNALGYRLKYLLTNFVLNNADPNDKSFAYSGTVLFENMAGTAEQQEQWKQRRQEVYEGSQMHFLRSALNNRIEEDGFRVWRLAANMKRPADSIINEKIRVYNILKKDDKKYKDSLSVWLGRQKMPRFYPTLIEFQLNKADIVNNTAQRGKFSLECSNDALYITYNKHRHFDRVGMGRLSEAANKSTTVVTFNDPEAFFDSNGSVYNPRSLSFDGAWLKNRLAGLLPVDYEPAGSAIADGDSSLVNNLTSKLKKLTDTNVVEKIYLHCDKPYYAANDTLYFKAYVTQAETHRPSQLSGVLYVDLADASNKTITSIKLQLSNCMARGDIALPATLQQGNYRLHAYTQLTQSNAPEYAFDRVIPIVSANNSLPAANSANRLVKKARPVIQFFPEGGSIVAGIKSKVAFKALAPDGLGAGAKGVVFDDKNKEAGSFSTTHLGMGYFMLDAKEGASYKAVVTFANGNVDTLQLPKSTEKGIAINVGDVTRAFTVKINANKAFYKDNRDKIFRLMVVSGGELTSYVCKLDKPELTLEVIKNELRTGVATITLFTATGEPLCERLAFVQNDDQLKLNLTRSQQDYQPREKITISMNVVNGKGEVAQGHFSASVINEDVVKVDENNEATILTDLLLTSDLKGHIEQPNYYFTDPNDKTAADLDLVMLTHGYRRFEWKKLLNNGYPTNAQTPEEGLQISGRVTTNSGKPVANGKVSLLGKINGLMMLDTLTDANGRFVFDRLSFADTVRFVVKARTATNGSNVKIELDKPTAPVLLPLAGLKTDDAIFAGKDMQAYLQNNKQYTEEQGKFGFNKVNALKTVTIKEKKDPAAGLIHSQNLNGPGNADQVVGPKDLEKLQGYANLYDALRAKVVGVQFMNNVMVSRRAGISKIDAAKDNMLIVVDGITMDDYPQFLTQLQVENVESVEVGLGTAYGAAYGPRAKGGVVIVTTKTARGNNLYTGYAPGIVTYTATGFYKAREFYAPKYEAATTNSTMADLRSTIYWQPELTTDTRGNATLEYFNADGKGTYRVVIEGIDADGNIGRQVYRYTVK
ncbi:carboxypeptidase-like regulatory domain-containing protein [Mucilaginibacter pedocola]|nr:carboxypeptidase-like regulatory domain-containing protein [Mucilaginibacter pedocola]